MDRTTDRANPAGEENEPRTRRSNGEGSEIKLGADGRWHAYLSFGVKSGGRRDRRHVSAPTRAQCAAKLRELQEKRDAGVVPSGSRTVTVAQWLDHWLDNIASAKVRPMTLDGYRQYVRNRITPAVGHYRLNQLQPEHVERFYREAASPGHRADPKTGRVVDMGPLSTASVIQCHRILSRALKVAVQRGLIARNVCTLVEPPPLRREEVDALSADEARAILVAASSVRNAARWSVALALGLRQGEALGLQWADIDPQAGTLRVRRALQRQLVQHGCEGTCGKSRATACPQRTGGGLVFVPPKSRAGNRTIVLPAQLAEALRTHRRVQAAERLAAGSEWLDLDLVFAQPNGRPIDPHSDWSQWKALLRAAGVRDARLHDARHTAATLALLQGVSARVVMQILGHSQIGLTLGTYSHVVPELAADAAERMNAALWGPTVPVPPENGHRDGTAVPRRPRPKNAGGQRLREKSRWGGWDSNPRPRDYESPALTS